MDKLVIDVVDNLSQLLHYLRRKLLFLHIF